MKDNEFICPHCHGFGKETPPIPKPRPILPTTVSAGLGLQDVVTNLVRMINDLYGRISWLEEVLVSKPCRHCGGVGRTGKVMD